MRKQVKSISALSKKAVVNVPTPHGPLVLVEPSPLVVRVVRKALRNGSRVTKTPMPAGTLFQQACWKAAKRIPRGETRTYLWLASRALRLLKRSPAQAGVCARAAGQAMRRNPWPVVIPCHRVIASDGSLGGFGGATRKGCSLLKMKMWLLQMER